jgi:hypothetical protein
VLTTDILTTSISDGNPQSSYTSTIFVSENIINLIRENLEYRNVNHRFKFNYVQRKFKYGFW